MSVISRLGVASCLSSQLCRPYGSATAALLDYCYNEEEEASQGKMKRAESEGLETPGRGVQWVIMGDPMVKRHVYAGWLAKLLEVPHISMGSLVRQELNPNSSLYKKIVAFVNQGKLVPEDVLFGLLSKRLEESYCRGDNGFVLDGIPRTKMQAEILDQIVDIDLVLNLKCTQESVVNKTSGGTNCSRFREFHPIATLGLYCESSGADSDAKCKEKFDMLWAQRKLVEEYYKEQKKVVEFEVGGAPAGDTWNGLLAALQLPHMNTNNNNNNVATPWHKLTP